MISAMAGETDRLFNLGQKYFNHHNVREMDALLSTGEVVSSSLLLMCLSSLGLKAKSFNASQLKLMTKKDSSNKFATLLSIDTAVIKNEIAQGVIPIFLVFRVLMKKEILQLLVMVGLTLQLWQ